MLKIYVLIMYKTERQRKIYHIYDISSIFLICFNTIYDMF